MARAPSLGPVLWGVLLGARCRPVHRHRRPKSAPWARLRRSSSYWPSCWKAAQGHSAWAGPLLRSPSPIARLGAATRLPAPLVRVVHSAVVNVSVESEVAVEDHPFYRDRDFRRFMKKFDLPIPRPGEIDIAKAWGPDSSWTRRAAMS